MSRGLSGGHPEYHGVTPDGMKIAVPEHQHNVALDLTRYEASLSRTFDDHWDAVLRIPYLIKDQTATVSFPNPMTGEEREAALRNNYIHHRTDTYQGFGDAEFSVGWRRKNLLGAGSITRFSFGLTLPLGDTGPDPWVLGDAGLQHTHIQMGNGTFDPIVDFYAGFPLSDKWALSLYGKARIPLYENDEGYRGSAEGSLIPRITYLPAKKLSLSAGLAANWYGYSYWNGKRDEDSGQFTLNATLSAGLKLSDTITGSAGVLLPLCTESWSSGGDSFDPATTFTFSVAKQF